MLWGLSRASSLSALACLIGCGPGPGIRTDDTGSGEASSSSDTTGAAPAADLPRADPACEDFGIGSIPSVQYQGDGLFGAPDSVPQYADCTVLASDSDSFELECSAAEIPWSVLVTGLSLRAEPMMPGDSVEVSAHDRTGVVINFSGLLVRRAGEDYFGLTQGGGPDFSVSPPGFVGGETTECVQDSGCPTYWGQWRFELIGGEEQAVKSGELATMVIGPEGVPISFWGHAFVGGPGFGEPNNCADVDAHAYAFVRSVW